MCLGPSCFAFIGLLPLVFGYDSWLGGKGVLVLYVLQGVGRGVWEASNKACFLAYFDYLDDKSLIGNNIIVQNGGASAIAFWVNAYSDASPTLADCQQKGIRLAWGHHQLLCLTFGRYTILLIVCVCCVQVNVLLMNLRLGQW